MMVAPGNTATAALQVTEAVTAERVGSGSVPVLATPEVLALVERAARAAVEASLDRDATTVGSRVDLEHLAPTPLGGAVTATATLAEVRGRRLLFAFEVTDGAGVVARGSHERVIVDRRRFLRSAAERSG